MLRRTFIILIIITMGSMAIVAYYINVQSMVDTAWHNDYQLLRMQRSTMDTMKRLAFQLGHQIYNDNQMATLLYGTKHTTQDKYLAFIQLNNYRTMIPYVESIYVYNGSDGTMTISSRHSGSMDVRMDEESSRIDPMIRSIIQNASASDINAPYPHVFLYDEEYKEDTFCYTFAVSEMYGDEKMKQGVFINYQAGWAQQIIKEQAGSQSETLMIARDGRVVFSTREGHIFQEVADTELFHAIQDNSADNPYLIAELDGQRVLLTMLPQDGGSWYYARLTPYRVILADSQQLLLIMFVIDAVLLLVYIGLSVLMSKHLYAPIDRINRQLDDTQTKQQVLERANQQKRMLRKLLLDVASSDQHEGLVEEVYRTDSELSEMAAYYVLVVHIDKYNRFCNTYSLGERAERMQTLMQISMDVMSRAFQMRTLELGDGSNIVFVLMQQAADELDSARWTELISEMRQKAAAQVNIKFSCAISGPGYHPGELSTLYHQAYNALKYRIFLEGSTTLFARDIEAYSDKSYSYPEEQESRMLTCILAGDSAQAVEIANGILWSVATYPFMVIHLTLSRLTMTLMKLMHKTEVGAFVIPPEVQETLMIASSMEEIDSFHTTVAYFDSAIEQLCQCMQSKRDTRYADMIDHVNELIEQHYQNPDCNLSFLAEKINISTAYLTRLYRSYTLKSIPDCINELRMENARKLLKENKEQSITEVSQRVGFSSSSYFCKAFKKEHGMSPNEYRNYINREE